MAAAMAKPECTHQFHKDQDQELRSAIDHLKRFSFSDQEDERQAWEDVFECFGAQVEDVEMMRELQIHIRNAVSGEEVKRVWLRPSDTVARLCEATLCEAGQVLAESHRFIFQCQELQHHVTLRHAGLCHGDTVDLIRVPLEWQCVTASHDGTARIWHLESEQQRSAVERVNSSASRECTGLDLKSHGVLRHAVFSPCKTRLLTMSTGQGGVGQLWCANSFEHLCSLQGGALSATFSSNGDSLVGLDADGNARTWSAETGRTLHKMSSGIEDAEMHFAQFSHCGRLVVVGEDCCVQLWDSSTGELLNTLHGHEDVVKTAAVSSDGELLLTASADGTARLWSCKTGECLQVLEGHAKPLALCSFSPGRLQALTASQDGLVKIWQLTDQQSAQLNTSGAGCHITAESMFTLKADGGVVNSACFSPDGACLLVSDASETVKLFGARSGELQSTFGGTHEDWVRAASFSDDGRLVATASYDGTAAIWDATTGTCVHALKGHDEAVVSADVISS
eukprot:TRINITY_DN1589_c0_g2_i4.p1 TRINITY_DN1589_c0_g2~~TRINITY_DN1589_c0_g2_i4.p1  ORF type:complete len:509 (-),score=77.97 TRINITY_DN1589_c0_g2_i4:352-1878(-)